MIHLHTLILSEFIIPLILKFHMLLFWGSCFPEDVVLQIPASKKDSEHPHGSHF